MAVSGELVQGSTLTEENGKLIAATTIVMVTETESPILSKALAQLGVPQPGDKLNNANPDLKVQVRGSEISGIEEASPDNIILVRVTINYVLQRPDVPQLAPLRGGTSLQQIQTSKDRSGDEILVTSGVEGAEPQVATVNVFQPQANLSFEKVIPTDDPDDEADKYAGKVNSDLYRGKAKRTWLCTRCDYELIDEAASPKRYKFIYELENNPNTWDVSVGFKKDDGTFESGTFVDVKWLEEISFAPLLSG